MKVTGSVTGVRKREYNGNEYVTIYIDDFPFEADKTLNVFPQAGDLIRGNARTYWPRAEGSQKSPRLYLTGWESFG